MSINRRSIDVRKMILNYRAERPTPGHIIQFSGGEPTIYPHFIEACRLAKDLGISWVQVAGNGIAFTDPEFAFRAKEAELDGIYLQFDGMADAIYKKTRGESLFKKKLQAIENAGKADLYVVLVCTVVRGVNNHGCARCRTEEVEPPIAAATLVTAAGCCSSDGNGQTGGCGCGDRHGNGPSDGKREALLQLLPEAK